MKKEIITHTIVFSFFIQSSCKTNLYQSLVRHYNITWLIQPVEKFIYRLINRFMQFDDYDHKKVWVTYKHSNKVINMFCPLLILQKTVLKK